MDCLSDITKRFCLSDVAKLALIQRLVAVHAVAFTSNQSRFSLRICAKNDWRQSITAIGNRRINQC